jgi:hypothetical protein
LVNERRQLGFDSEDVSTSKVAAALPTGDPLAAALQSLYVRTKAQPLPIDPYNDEGLLFRAYNYRHQATHRWRSTFEFRIGPVPIATLHLDPRGGAHGGSRNSVERDLQAMLDLITARCAAALALC